MSIAIDKNKCIGCGRCREICPGSLIKQDKEKKAYIAYPKECWGCTSCVKECPKGAVAFYLGADIGGMGSKVYIDKTDNGFKWSINKYDGSIIEEYIDSRKSNEY